MYKIKSIVELFYNLILDYKIIIFYIEQKIIKTQLKTFPNSYKNYKKMQISYD